MSLVLALLVVAAFAGIVGRTRVLEHVSNAARRARDTYSIVADSSLTDDQKERRLREGASRLFGLLAHIIFGSLLALGLPLGGVWALDRIGGASLSEVLGILMRLDFLLAVSAVGIVVTWWVHRPRM